MTARAIVSHLHGRVDVDAARAWRRDLHIAVRTGPVPGTVRLLVDQRQYEPADLAAHRMVRLVVPDLLATHGLHPALADAVGVSGVAVARAPDQRIVACALVHHDEFKMTSLNRLVGRPDQRFFSDFVAAQEWLAERFGPPLGRSTAAAPLPPCCTTPVGVAPPRPRTSTHVMKENEI